MLRAGERTILAVNERLYFIQQEFCVAIRPAAAEPGYVSRRVFADSSFGVVHADDDKRFDLPRTDAMIRGLPDVPVLPRNEGRGAVKEILSVMKIEDGKLARRLLLVSRRCVNDEVALIAKEARAKLFMFAELRGAHGAVFTGESFAATDGPAGTCSSIVQFAPAPLPRLWRCALSHTLPRGPRRIARVPSLPRVKRQENSSRPICQVVRRALRHSSGISRDQCSRQRRNCRSANPVCLREPLSGVHGSGPGRR